jgi:murein DD-endopeptidase MepM/ murein hydrolase activator NlpD
MERRSDNIGDAGRVDFDRRRSQARQTLPGRELGDTPLSVHDTIARHRQQTKRLDGQPVTPAEDAVPADAGDASLVNTEDCASPGQPPSAGTSSRFARPSLDQSADVSRPRRGTAYSRRFAEPQGAAGYAESAAAAPADEETPPPSPEAAAPEFPASAIPAPETAEPAPDPADHTPRAQAQGPSKLKFGADEAPSPGNIVVKARGKAERAQGKLDAAEKKLPQKRRLTVDKAFDAETGKPKRALRFETEVKSKHAHLKGPAVTRPVKTGANSLIAYGHGKIYRAEHENVGVKAAHRGEMLTEGGLRFAYRLHKTTPYRRVERLGKKTAKLNMKAEYLQALGDNPKLKSNILSRMAQKRKIRKQYAKAAREAKKTLQKVKKTGDVIGRTGQAAVRFVARHPVLIGAVAALGLLIVLISGLFTSCSNLVSGGGSAISASTYLAEDSDVDDAELFYTEWETDLQLQIAGAEASNPGFDEYRYNVGDISHNPYELIAYLTAGYRDFAYSNVEADLRAIFAEQYQLTFTESTETRYRAVTRTDPNTGEEYEEQEAYDWRVLTVTLTARSFTDVVSSRLSSGQTGHYNLLLQTKGNRQYAGSPFDFNWLPYVSSYYGWRVHPITGAKDYHKAVDIAVPEGSEIRAANEGVVSVGYDAGGFGNYVTVTGRDGLVTKYAHCSEVLVSNGRTVGAGEVIARAGSTGQSTGAHLHFEIIRNGRYLNPLFFSQTDDDGGLPPG